MTLRAYHVGGIVCRMALTSRDGRWRWDARLGGWHAIDACSPLRLRLNEETNEYPARLEDG